MKASDQQKIRNQASSEKHGEHNKRYIYFLEFKIRPAQPVGYQAGKQHAGHGSHRTLRHGNCKCSDNASVPEYGLEIIQRPHPRPQVDAAAHIVLSFIKSPYNNKPQRIGHNKNENYHYNNINHIKWLNPANLSFLVHAHPAFLKKVLFRLSYWSSYWLPTKGLPQLLI